MLTGVLVAVVTPTALAHEGETHTVANYAVSTAQEPLSPFVGEKVSVTFTITDEHGQPVRNLQGNLVINKIIVQQFTNKNSIQEEKEVSRVPGSTNQDGEVTLEYAFSEEGLYDAEFIWGPNQEKESAGQQILARDPTSYFVAEELTKRIWLFIVIALGGIVVGSAGTFILLTSSLHPKK